MDPAATLAPAAESVQTGYQPNDTLTIALPSHLGAWAWSNRQSLGSIISDVDPASGIGIPVAFGAGLISFLSPCVLPLVPGYISAVAGVAPSEIRAARVIGPSLAFVASFSSSASSPRSSARAQLTHCASLPTAITIGRSAASKS